jgi:hypothetical protein
MPETAVDSYRSVLRDVLTLGVRKRAFGEQVWVDEVVTSYAGVLDCGELDLLEHLATRDAVFDYTSLEGPRGTVTEVAGWLRAEFERAPARQHLITNRLCDIRLGRARVVASYFTPVLRQDGAERAVWSPSGGYLDIHLERRLAHGWRISSLVTTQTWHTDAT